MLALISVQARLDSSHVSHFIFREYKKCLYDYDSHNSFRNSRLKMSLMRQVYTETPKISQKSIKNLKRVESCQSVALLKPRPLRHSPEDMSETRRMTV